MASPDAHPAGASRSTVGADARDLPRGTGQRQQLP